MVGWKDRLLGLVGRNEPDQGAVDPDLCLKASPDISPGERVSHCTVLIEKGDPALRARAHNARGLAYRALGKKQAARAEYDKAIALDASNEVFFLNRATVANELDDHGSALRDLARAIELDPNYARAYEDRADIFHELGDFEDALREIDIALSFKPTEYRHYRRGVILVDLARYPEAIESLTAALALEPEDARTLERRAAAFLMLDRAAEAVADLEKALALKPNSRRVQATLGSALRSVDPQRALDHCNKALASNPDDPATLNNRSYLHAVLGNMDAAVADLDRAIKLAPDEPTFRMNRAVVRIEAGRFAEADRDLERGLADDRDDPHLLSVSARLACAQGEWVRAHTIVAHVLDGSPEFADALCVLGWIHGAENRHAEARAVFDRVLSKSRSNASGGLSDRVRWTALYGRGLARQSQGDVEGGDADLDAARAIKPRADEIVALWSRRPSGTAVH